MLRFNSYISVYYYIKDQTTAIVLEYNEYNVAIEYVRATHLSVNVLQ